MELVRVMISVIICTYNRSKLLENTLRSLLDIKAPALTDWELLVIDNNSKDSTRHVVENFIQLQKLPLRYVFELRQGLSHARNRGVSESSGDVIAFIDDDVIVPDDWLIQVDRAFSLHDADVIGGKAILRFEQAIPSWLDSETAKCLGAFDRGNTDILIQSINDGMPGIGANICFKKGIFAKVGLFDATVGRTGKKLLMGEEAELVRRVLISGRKCLYFPQLYLYHIISSDKISKDYVLRWHFRMGQWEAQTNKYNNYSSMKKMGEGYWALKTMFVGIMIYLKELLLGNKDKSFRQKVHINKMAGYLSKVFT